MSYILDALKKADREREQGQVPGLNAQPAHGTDAEAAAPSSGLPPMVWAGVGMALTLVGLLAWQHWPVTSPAREATQTAPGDGQAAATTPAGRERLAVAPMAAGATPRPTQRPAPSPTTDDGVRMQVDGAGERGSRAAQPVLSVPGPGRANATGLSPQATAREPATTTTEAQAAPARSTGSLPQLSDLPESFRRDMPALQVGGAMYSPNAAQRMLVLNGQVFHEGDHPENGLKLEEIRLKSAVMSFRGQRFELQY